MTEHDDLQQRLRHLGSRPVDRARQSADLTAMAQVSPRARRSLLGSKVRVAAAFLAGLLLGGTGLAAADALPDPAQHVAHTVLSQVGVEVPNPPRYHGAECGAEVKKNHGAYVRDDHSLAQSRCGKPDKAATGADDDADPSGTGPAGGKGNGRAKGPCQGKPSWAGNKTMTDDEVAAAKAARVAECGEDDEAVDGLETDLDADETTRSDEPEPDPEATTTTAEVTTTTADTTTTTTAETTTTTAG